jgi:hypothetical protein
MSRERQESYMSIQPAILLADWYFGEFRRQTNRAPEHGAAYEDTAWPLDLLSREQLLPARQHVETRPMSQMLETGLRQPATPSFRCELCSMKRLLRVLYTARGAVLAGTLMLAAIGGYLGQGTAASVVGASGHFGSQVHATPGGQGAPQFRIWCPCPSGLIPESIPACW